MKRTRHARARENRSLRCGGEGKETLVTECRNFTEKRFSANGRQWYIRHLRNEKETWPSYLLLLLGLLLGTGQEMANIWPVRPQKRFQFLFVFPKWRIAIGIRAADKGSCFFAVLVWAYPRVSLGLKVSRQKAQNLTDSSRKKLFFGANPQNLRSTINRKEVPRYFSWSSWTSGPWRNL